MTKTSDSEVRGYTRAPQTQAASSHVREGAVIQQIVMHKEIAYYTSTHNLII